MSVLKQVYAAPGRVRAVYRFVLRARGQTVDRAELVRLVAPPSLSGQPDGRPGDDITGTVNEAVKMGLLATTGDRADAVLSLVPDLSAAARDPRRGDAVLADTLADLLLTGPMAAENHDLAVALSWLLAQDVYATPGTPRELERVLIGQDKAGVTDLNLTRLGQLEDWAVFLGLAGHCGGLVADPTAFLRRRLGTVIGGQRRATMPQAMARLAELCPAFEGGRARSQVEEAIPALAREGHGLSTATAHAWLRLQDEGLVELSMESDADMRLLPAGPGVPPVSVSRVALTAAGERALGRKAVAA